MSENVDVLEGGVRHGEHTVVVLDDDPSILSGLDNLLTAYGYRVRLYLHKEAFFSGGMPPPPACLVLDNQLGNGMSGAQVHAEVQLRGWFLPTVFVTAHWNLQSVVHAMRTGADGFLTKPYDPAEMVTAVAQALRYSLNHQRASSLAAKARDRALALTAPECAIVRCVAAGLPNKEIAAQLGLSLDVVKARRGRAMRKMGAGNVAELARLAALAGIIG